MYNLYILVKQPLDILEGGGKMVRIREETFLPTSLIHVIPFSNVWVAKPGFSLIFLSKKVNETHLVMHITCKI